MNGPPRTRRINQGRGHRYELDGARADGVTWILRGLPKPALIDWASRATAGYAVDHWTELAAMSPSERLRTLERARYEVQTSAGERGSDVHRIAHALTQGAEVDVPEELAHHVDAYLAFVERWRPTEELAELVVINRRWRYMGSADLVARLVDGARWLLDYKTGGVYPEAVLQLAGYANAETYLDAEGLEHPMPAIDRAGIVALRADGFDLYPVDRALEPATFRLFLHAQQIARFMDASRPELRGDWIGDALRPLEVTP